MSRIFTKDTKVRVVTAIFLLLLSSPILFAQNYNLKIDGLCSKNYVQTPEMSAIRRVALSSVNYSTGTVDIRIPLFDIECGDLKLPIYLSYNSAGIKVNEPSGWVGQNWSLHAEPVLTRSLRGHCDNNGDFNFYKDRNSYYWMRKYLDNNILCTDDIMPDEYNFTLLEGGGMFMYGSNEEGKSKFVCLPYDDIEISGGGECISITDPLGIKYSYSGGVDYSFSPLMYKTAWHASTVTAANGIDCISFRYNNVQRVNIKRHEDHMVVVDDYIPSDPLNNSMGYTNLDQIQPNRIEIWPDVEELFRMPVIYKTFDDQTKSYQMDDTYNLVDDGRVIDKISYYPNISYECQRLSEISFLGGKVTFTVDNNKNLSSITFMNNKGQIIKQFVLDYSLSRDRYYLTNVKELSMDGEVVSSYHLNYNPTGGVCRPGGRAYDFWGYNNSDYLYDYISLVPKMKLYTHRYNSSMEIVRDSLTIGGDPDNWIKKVRHADEYYMQCGMLSGIEHPTGAKETFVWEANKARIEDRFYDTENSAFRITDELEGKDGIYTMGGLRIKEINVTENGECKSKRIFKYGKKEDGAGTTPLRDGINYFMRTQTKIYDNQLIRQNLGKSQSRYRTLSSSPIIPFTYYNGSSVMYDMVTEYTYSNDAPCYKTIYSYKLPELVGNDVLTELDVWDFHLHNYDKWFSDYLRSKETYEKTNTGFKLVSSDYYDYDMNSHKSSYTVRGCEFRNDFHENFSDGDFNLISNIAYSSYKDYSVTPKAKLLTSHAHTEVMSNGVRMANLQTYNYDNPSDIRMTSQTTSRSDDKYSIYTSYPSSINNGIYADMVKKNMLDYPVEERVERNGKVVSARLMTYSDQDGSYYPNKVYTYTPGTTACAFNSFVKYSGTEINNLYVPLFDIGYNNGRIEHLTDQQGIITYYTWDNTHQYPTRERIVGGNKTHERTFTYIPGIGMTSETKPNKDVTSYSYDTAGRLAEIKDCNGNSLWKYLYKYISGNPINGTINYK